MKVLPQRRRSETFKRHLGRRGIFVTVGYHVDGSIGEVFVDTAKAGQEMKALLSALAVSISIGLRHGVPLSIFIENLMIHEPTELLWQVGDILREASESPTSISV